MDREQSILIGDRCVGLNCPPFIIAEMSGNHNHSLERALEIVDAAAAAGAHALKLQTYTADTMTLDISEREFFIKDPASLWKGRSLYDLYNEAHTPWEWHKPIFDRCYERGMLCFSTPFDDTAVAFLEELQVPCYKIASFENNDLPLIRKVAATGKPMIISTGLATLSELDETVRTAREYGCKNLILLKCTSSYPATPEHSNIRTIPHLREMFDCEVGLSDHTMGIGGALAAVALGATVIEKHFTSRRSDGGVDASFSMEPDEFSRLVMESERAWQSLGTISYGKSASEVNSAQFRRSIYVVNDIQPGECLTTNNLKVIRPGLGLEPKYLDVVLGKRSLNRISRGTPLSWELFLS